MKTITKIFLITLLALPFLSGVTYGKKFITRKEIRSLERSGHLFYLGRYTWRTRGGLIIKGKDKKKLSRLEHIMRHSKDIKQRKKHGVFFVNKNHIIELMDKTWKKIKSGVLKGKEGRGIIAYTYNTGLIVGYLGGKIGEKKNHPVLKSVRLVLIKNTPNVITFSPIKN